jgi:hypothetical protein
MVAEPKVIPVEPDSELSRLVDQAEETPIVLVRDGRRFRIVREEDAGPFAGYDPERVLAAIEQAAGLFDGMDVEWLKTGLRSQRGQARRGRRS